MSDRLKQLQTDKIEAMKAKDRTTKDVLILVINEANTIAKNDGNREVTDADVIQALNRSMKKARETRDILVQQSADTSVPDGEIEVITRYLPKQMDEAETRAAIEAIIAQALAEQANPKALKGVVMKNLKEQHNGSYDPRLAAGLVDSAIASAIESSDG